MKTNAQQLNRSVWRNENWTTHLAHEEVTWLKGPAAIGVLREPLTKVQDQLDAAIRQNAFRRRIGSWTITFESPKTLDKTIEWRSWRNLVITHHRASKIITDSMGWRPLRHPVLPP